MVKDGGPDDASADNNGAVVRFHPRPLVTEAPVPRATELSGAGLDNHVQKGAAGHILSASVAFVALSGGAEYAYAWLFASAVTARLCAAGKPPFPRLTRTSWLWFKPFLEGAVGERRQSEADGEQRIACVVEDL